MRVRRAWCLSGLLVLGCTAEPDEPTSTESSGTSEAPTTMSGTSVATATATATSTGGGTTSDSGVPDGSSGTTDDGGSSSEGIPPVIFDLGEEPDIAGGDPCDGSVLALPATIRDFASSHPDFEAFWGSDASTGLVLDMLGADQTPVYNPAAPFPPPGSSPTQITSAATFSDWYHDVPGTNVPVPLEIELTETPPGSGVFVFEDTTFFPIDMDGWNAAPGPNNETFPDTLGDQHNFHFTTEIHTSFVYEPGQLFTFIGDDDLWVFIDEVLAIDLGGLHGQLQGSVDLDTLGLVAGETYSMDIFHAERRHDGSNFRIETSIECFFPPAG